MALTYPHSDFPANFNSKEYPYHGGVSYGYGNGTVSGNAFAFMASSMGDN